MDAPIVSTHIQLLFVYVDGRVLFMFRADYLARVHNHENQIIHHINNIFAFSKNEFDLIYYLLP